VAEIRLAAIWDVLMHVDTVMLASAAGSKTYDWTVIVQFWPIAAASFLVSLLATPVCRQLALRLRIVDRPDDFLKPHKQPIPYLGGVAIFLGWLAGIGLMLVLQYNASESMHVRIPIMVAIAAAGLVIMLIGLFDDMKVMPPRPKLIANVLVGLFLIWMGIGDGIVNAFVREMGVKFGAQERWLELMYSVPLTLFIVVGACNATNLIDGLDGLCTGVLGIISFGFFVLAAHLRLYGDEPVCNERIVLALAMLGAAAGFLPFNRNPARIFMGDAGSMLLGLNAAVILLLFGGGKRPMINWMIGSVMVFGLPIADMLLTMARRWRNGRPLMQGDRSHFYDQLVDRGLSVKRVVTISYLLTTVFMLVGVSVIFLRIRHAVLAYLATVALIVVAVWKLNMAGIEPNRQRGADSSGPSKPTAHA
jgi:UDP-GlcNAc:undecaprenyl-phosphate GlcNAc-1-phosphate transferase